MTWFYCNLCGHITPDTHEGERDMLVHVIKKHDKGLSELEASWNSDDISIKEDAELFDEIMREIDEAGLMHTSALNDSVHEMLREKAAALNDAGSERQVEEMCQWWGVDGAVREVRAVIEESKKGDSHGSE